MSYDDDDREDDYGRSSPPRGKSGRDDSPSFDSTKLVAEDGRLLGMKVSKDLAGQINTFYPALLTYLSEWGEKIAGPAAERMARQMGKSEAEVLRVGGHARDVTGYGIIFFKPAMEMLGNVWEAGRNTTELSSALKPLGKEGWECETVQTVKNRTRSIFVQNLTRSATGIVGTFPAWYSKVSKQRVLNEERTRQAEFEEAKKDPKKLAEWFKKEKGMVHGADPMMERRALDLMLEEEEKAYRAKFDAFKKSTEAEAAKKQFREDTRLPDNVNEVSTYSLQKLKRYGVNTDYLQRSLNEAPTVSAESKRHGSTYKPKTREEVWREFKENFNRKELKRIEEEAIRAAFVRKEGAWDHNWAQAYDFGVERGGRDSNRPATIRDHWVKTFEERMTAAREGEKTAKASELHAGKSDKDNNHIATLAAGLGAGLASEWLGGLIGVEKEGKNKEPTAWDYIDALKKIQRKALDSGENLPETVSLSEPLATSLRDAMRVRGDGTPERELSYEIVIHEIIQRNESTRGRPPVHKHDFEHLEQAGWDGKRIAEIPDTELTPYEIAVTRMAKLVETGQLSAIALNLLVGHKKYKVTDVLQQNIDDGSKKQGVLSRIDAVMQNYRLRDDVDEEKATRARGGIIITDDQIRAGFGPGGLKGDQRAFTYALLEAVVQNKKELCKITGMNAEQCAALGSEVGPRFNHLMDAAVLEMAAAIRDNPEALEKQIKLTEDERKIIASLAGRVEEGGKDVADAAENREQLRTAQTAVANALMTRPKAEDGQKEPGFWQRVVDRMRHPRPKEEAAQAVEGDDEAPFSRKVGKTRDDDRWAGEGKAAMQKAQDSGKEDLGYDDDSEINDPGEVDKPESRFAKRVRSGDGASLKPAKSRGRHATDSGAESFTPGGVSL